MYACTRSVDGECVVYCDADAERFEYRRQKLPKHHWPAGVEEVVVARAVRHAADADDEIASIP
jgi:hypothetical protein